MDEQTAKIITIIIIVISVFLIVKLIKMVKRGLYKLASLYFLLTAGTGTGTTYILNHLTNNPQ